MLFEFLLSPGFGGVMVGVAAILGLWGVRQRMGLDRAIDAEGSALRRWWELAHYVDRQLERPQTVASLARLQRLIETMNASGTAFSKAQAMMGAWLSWKVYEKVLAYRAADALPEAVAGRLSADDAQLCDDVAHRSLALIERLEAGQEGRPEGV